MPNFRAGSQFYGVESNSMHTAATHFTIPGLTRNPWRYHPPVTIPGLTRNP